MLAFVLVPVLVGLSMLAQRPVARRLGVRERFWPLAPMPATVPLRVQLKVRGAGLAFTFFLVVLAAFAQRVREDELTAQLEVVPGHAAAEAGLETGDVVREVNGRRVESFAELRDAILQPSAPLRVGVERGGQRLEKVVTLRDGLLGVKPGGARRPVSIDAAAREAVLTPFRLPVALARIMLAAAQGTATPVVGAAASTPPWAAMLLIPLTVSWWAQLALELLILSLFRRARAGT